ncbi:MAG: hypothetical protein D6712_16070 [Chloroflexi bacterium]|nr:MAG: hypothetical protein D6712_16070 [Chloroflexota bacterium]
MQRRLILIVGGGILILSIVLIIAMTAVFVPEAEPQYDVAVRFVKAAATGDEVTAFALLAPELQDAVRENCPDGSASGCIQSYPPPEWGDFLNVVFRRSRPVGDGTWDVLLIATYEDDQGYSGICIYTHTAQDESGEWRVQRWSGFVSCDLPDAGLDGLAADGAPNQMP